jgi:hypothetical protein
MRRNSIAFARVCPISDCAAPNIANGIADFMRYGGGCPRGKTAAVIYLSSTLSEV